MSTIPPQVPQPQAVAPGPKGWSVGRAVGLAVAALVIGGVGGYLIGHSGGGSTTSGPTTFAEALQQFRAGKLPSGNTGSGVGGGAGGGGTGAAGGGIGGGGGRFGGVTGPVTANDGTSITVRTRNGDVKVMIDPSTKVSKSVDGTAADLTVGSDVRVQSTGNASSSGGTVTATTIQQVPAGSLPNFAGNGGAGAGGAGGGTN